MATLLALLCIALLASANGANDNFKGVATLFGSGVADYRKALNWGTAATLAGSIAAVFITAHLVAAFSGKQIVPAATLALPSFGLAVCLACATTVALATRFGLPISTTHALTGALLGAALAAPEAAVNWEKAGKAFFLPLAAGPLISIALAVSLYPLLTRLRAGLGIQPESCACVGEVATPVAGGSAVASMAISTGTAPECRRYYTGAVLGLEAGRALDALHYLSAGLVSFARGVNDTPKLVALALLAAPVLGSGFGSFAGIGLAIAAGGLLFARRVAETVAHKITPMNPGQGLTANVITAGLVMAASPLGLPLSTTHVSCGAIFGIGAVTGQARWKTIAGIFAAWLVTLPLAAALGALLLRALT